MCANFFTDTLDGNPSELYSTREGRWRRDLKDSPVSKQKGNLGTCSTPWYHHPFLVTPVQSVRLLPVPRSHLHDHNGCRSTHAGVGTRLSIFEMYPCRHGDRRVPVPGCTMETQPPSVIVYVESGIGKLSLVSLRGVRFTVIKSLS